MNLRPLMFGYLREEQISRPLDDVEQRLRAFAASEGYTLGSMYHDAGELTGALWVLTRELERAECRRVIVPSRTHLAPVPAARAVLLSKLASLSPSVQVWSLSPRELRSVLIRSTRDIEGTAVPTVLGRFRLRPSESALLAARLHVHERLTRAGLRELVDACEAVVATILTEATESALAVQASDHPIYAQIDATLNELEVRLLAWSSTLEVQIVESRSHASDLIPSALSQFGQSGRKPARGGGTLTWCAISLPTRWGRTVRSTHTDPSTAGPSRSGPGR